MPTPVHRLPESALPYWRAGIRSDDAIVAARVAEKHLRTLRDEFIRSAIQSGLTPVFIAGLLGVSVATVRRVSAMVPCPLPRLHDPAA